MDINKEKLQYLFEFIDEYLDILINGALGKNPNAARYSAVTVYNIINYYIETENKIGTDLPFNDVKTYFLYKYSKYRHSKYEYFKFKISTLKESRRGAVIKPDLSDNEKVCYLFKFLDEYICKLINDVLTDSKTDPNYSAVAATNVIKCYIEIENQLGTELPFNNVETFFKAKGFSKDEYIQFEESRESESKYYGDVQY